MRSHTCELVWNALSNQDFRLLGDLPLGSQLSHLHFSAYFALAFQFLLGLCVSGLTLLWLFSSYSAYAFQVLLCCGFSVLTQLMRFRSYFAVVFQFLLGLHVSDLTLPDSWDRTFRKGSLMV